MKALIFLLFGLFFLSCGTVFALENDIGYSRIHPASPLYFLKSIRENLELKMALTDRVKSLRELEFATRRLREARTLVSIDQDLIVPTLERYKYHLNLLNELLKGIQDEEVLTKTKQSLGIHLEVLQKLHNQVSSLRAKMTIRSAMNRIILWPDLPSYYKLPTCNLFAFEATSSSELNQTEKVVLIQRAQNCFESASGSGKIR